MDVTYTTARQVSEHLPNCCMKPGTALLLTFCVPIFLQVCYWCYSHWPLLPFISRIPAPVIKRMCIFVYPYLRKAHNKTCGRTTTLISLRHVIKGRARGWVNTLATGFASQVIRSTIIYTTVIFQLHESIRQGKRSLFLPLSCPDRPRSPSSLLSKWYETIIFRRWINGRNAKQITLIHTVPGSTSAMLHLYQPVTNLRHLQQGKLYINSEGAFTTD